MKIGAEELNEVLTLWGLSEATRAVMIAAAENERGSLDGAWLFRYYGDLPSKADELEELFREMSGARHAIAVNSGTSALVAALVALGVGPGDEVIVPAYTFIATAAAVVAAGAIPVIAEIDASMTMDPRDVLAKVTARTRAIVPVHMRGMVCDMQSLCELAAEAGLVVVEDVAQACGATVRGKWAGRYGSVGCFSFGQYKIVSAGEGGMVVTDDDYLALRIRSYHDTAACWRPDRYARERRPGELFAGQNYRMNEMSAAVALAQLRKLDAYLTRRRSVYAEVVECLGGTDLVTVSGSNDRSGDAGIALCLQAATKDLAKGLVDELKGQGLPAGGRHDEGQRDWHIYRFWEYILERKAAHDSGFPYNQVPPADLPDYSEGACPRTLDLLERSLFIRLSELDPSMNGRDLAAVIIAAGLKASGSES